MRITTAIRHGSDVFRPGDEKALAEAEGIDMAFLSSIGAVEGYEAQEVQAPPATDSARKLAREHGIDLSAVEGTGSGGKITKADVEKHVS